MCPYDASPLQSSRTPLGTSFDPVATRTNPGTNCGDQKIAHHLAPRLR